MDVLTLRGRLEEWLRSRIGYGDLGAEWWFLGLEEACGDANVEVPVRLLGGAVEDFLEAHARMFPCGLYRNLFEPPVRAQETLRPLIKMLLAAKGLPADLSSIKQYQGTL